MEQVGEIFGFPVYTHPDLPPGEVALVGVGQGLEVRWNGCGELVLRRRPVVARIVGLEVPSGRGVAPTPDQLELLE